MKTVTRFTNLFVGAFCGFGAALFFSFSMFILIISSLVTPLIVSAEEGLPLAGFDSTVFNREMTISMCICHVEADTNYQKLLYGTFNMKEWQPYCGFQKKITPLGKSSSFVLNVRQYYSS